MIEFRKAIDESFADNLAKDASIRASETRNNSSMFKAANLLNKNYDAYWATNDETTAAQIELEFPKQQTFNRLLLQEYISLGQRVAEFSVEYWNESAGNWTLLTQATTIGYKRILRFPSVTSTKIRINIEQSLACLVLNSIEVYKAPE
ncbi:MAG: discoidin domain-containing protein [Mediterranea sp.]|nr:discoidin domain-containing protein [Mediterranea sp.]